MNSMDPFLGEGRAPKRRVPLPQLQPVRRRDRRGRGKRPHQVVRRAHAAGQGMRQFPQN